MNISKTEEPLRAAPPLFVINILVFIRPAFTYRLCSSKIWHIDAEINDADAAFDDPQTYRVAALFGGIVICRSQEMFFDLAVEGIEIFFHFFLDVRGKFFGKIFQSVFPSEVSR